MEKLVSYGPKGAQCEQNIEKEINEANRTNNKMCKNNAKRVANLEQVNVSKEQGGEVKRMNQKQ